MRRSNIRGKPPKWFYGPGVACTREFLYRKGFVFIRNARRARAVQRPTTLKKKIGAIDPDPVKVGHDLGQVVGATDAPWGVKISDDASQVLGQAADVVIHSTSSALPKVMDQLLACLEAESCVVSTCEELSYPYRTYPDLAARLDTAAKEWGVALVGTGVNPGFVMDKLGLTLSAASQRVEEARVVRVVDASNRRLPLQKKIGAGMTPEEFRQ